MGDSSEDISVMVIGAGSCGRLIAQGLRKAGISCTLFEQDASLDQRSRDWDFGIYWSQTPLSYCLPEDVNSQVLGAQVDNVAPHADTYLPLYNGETGELMQKVPTPWYLRLRRREFSRVLGTGLDIRYNKRLVGFDATSGPGVTATFTDGTQHTASLLIGTEGAHSRTRLELLGQEKGKVTRSPFVLSVTISKLPVEKGLQLLNLHHRALIAHHPNGSFWWYGVHDAYDKSDPADYEFLFMTGWEQTEPINFQNSKAIIADMKQRAEFMVEPLRSISAAIDDESEAWSNQLPYWPTQRWEDHPARGKVTLAGDAAHPMLPHRGQGLNNAVLDCQSLVKEVEVMPEHTVSALKEAVKRYEEALWERGLEAVMSNLDNSIAVHDWERLKGSGLFKGGLGQHVR